VIVNSVMDSLFLSKRGDVVFTFALTHYPLQSEKEFRDINFVNNCFKM
jgi:hypothetical protein